MDPLEEDPTWNFDVPAKQSAATLAREDDEENAINDLAFDIYQDKEIATMISAVLIAKNNAVKGRF